MRAVKYLVPMLFLTALSVAPASADYPPTFKPVSGLSQRAQNSGFKVFSTAKAIKKNECREYTTDANAVRAIESYDLHLPGVTEQVNQCFVLRVINLDTRADVVLKNVITEKHIVLGGVQTSAKGSVRFPGISYSSPGLYHLSVTDATGTWYAHIVIR